jgi:hypothetical protein
MEQSEVTNLGQFKPKQSKTLPVTLRAFRRRTGFQSTRTCPSQSDAKGHAEVVVSQSSLGHPGAGHGGQSYKFNDQEITTIQK